MGNTDYKQKVITVGHIDSKDGRHIIKDQDGEWYSFFDKEYKKEGDSEAFRTFKDLGVANQTVWKITYYESIKGDTTYKNITIFQEANGEEKVQAPPFVDNDKIEKKQDKKEEARGNNIKFNMCLKCASEAFSHKQIERNQIKDYANELYLMEVEEVNVDIEKIFD